MIQLSDFDVYSADLIIYLDSKLQFDRTINAAVIQLIIILINDILNRE